jgi:hypothetical protein
MLGKHIPALAPIMEMHLGTVLHKKINLCLVPMREDWKIKIPENYTYAWFDGGDLHSLCSS